MRNVFEPVIALLFGFGIGRLGRALYHGETLTEAINRSLPTAATGVVLMILFYVVGRIVATQLKVD